jgi:hypothetical protein
MTDLNFKFIAEPIQVIYNSPPLFEKAPSCPNAIIWQGQTFYIEEVLSEWSDFTRRGRMGKNMKPEHSSRASRIGSWGVGRFYFRVKTSSLQVFDIYYDRAPVDVDDRKGKWFLLGERTAI